MKHWMAGSKSPAGRVSVRGEQEPGAGTAVPATGEAVQRAGLFASALQQLAHLPLGHHRTQSHVSQSMANWILGHGNPSQSTKLAHFFKKLHLIHR